MPARGGSAFGGKLPTILELLQAGVHFGHQKSRWHPKMKNYIFIERGGVHIIDLEKTLTKLQIVADFASGVAQKGGVILFVGTKKQSQKTIEKYAKECGMPFVRERWIGGLFTNFANVGKLVRKYRDLKEKRESGALNKYTKKEQSLFAKEIEKLDKLVGGLGDLRKIPEAIFVVDAKKEKTAVEEALKKGVPIIGFADTNINPDDLTYPIPANDDAVKSIEIITSVICEAIKEGKAKQEKTPIA
ncbi:MAG: 30S ribosomal protein S2 [Patescibacteria group bacterium]